MHHMQLHFYKSVEMAVRGITTAPADPAMQGAECEGAQMSCLKMSISKQLVCFKL